MNDETELSIDEPGGGRAVVMVTVDFRAAFERAPIGMMVLRKEIIIAANRALCAMFEVTSEELLGEPFRTLFPDGEAYDSMVPAMRASLAQAGVYREHRLMRRRHAAPDEPPFLCQVNLQYLDLDGAHRLLICTMDDLSQPAQDHADLTPRERDVAALLRKRYTAKEIGKCLGISHRTVEVHRSRLMRKYGVKTAAALLRHLLQNPLDGAGEPADAEPPGPNPDPLAMRLDASQGPAANALHYTRRSSAPAHGPWG